MITQWIAHLVLVTALAGALRADEPAAYDPLAAPAGWNPKTLDLDVQDAARDRTIPIRIYFPQTEAAAPVVVFSHGLGGSREGNAYMGRHWSARGYLCVFLQHPGSDDGVWKDTAARKRMDAMSAAASGQNLLLRVKDVPVALDQIAKWHATEGHPLHGRLDMERVGMSGHSFGAVTTQAVSGQSILPGDRRFTDPRIRAAIAYSPSVPNRSNAAVAFGSVNIPWMLQTGTRDIAPIGGADMASRLGVFPALPPGDKYELVLDGAEHSAFSERALPGDAAPRNPNHHRVILALSTAFWDAYLRKDEKARAWLTGDGPKSVLESGDKWQLK